MPKICPPIPPFGKTTHLNAPKIAEDYKKKIGQENHLIFSFKYLDLDHHKFSCEKCNTGWFLKLFRRKKDYCGMTFEEIKRGGNSTRCHPIAWEKTAVPKGFELKGIGEDVRLDFQLGISKKKGRIFGFVIENVFYVVWFDPEHNVYG